MIVELGSLLFMGEFHFTELFVFELLFAMLPFDTAPFRIDILTFLLVFDHFLVKDFEILIETKHPTGSHELTHLDEDIFLIFVKLMG